MKAADLITSNPEVELLYATLCKNLLQFWKYFRLTEKVKVLFELSQKRVFRPPDFSEHDKITSFLNELDLEKLVRRNF